MEPTVSNKMVRTQRLSAPLLSALVASLCFTSLATEARQGVYPDHILVGGVMDLEGQSRGLGQGMRQGVMAAFSGERIQGKRLEYSTLNDSYTPSLTIKATEKLAQQDVFVMLGNVGTPTAKVALPILDRYRIPAVGFFTGAGLLRPGVGEVVNYRASYAQEAAAVIGKSLKAGVKPNQICAYVQNDAYGMAGVSGIKKALRRVSGTTEIIRRIDRILGVKGDNPARNNIGPVGVYQRNTLTSRAGYQSLKNWETQQNTECKLVVTVGAYSAIGRFAGYSRYRGDDWVISAVSFTGAENLGNTLTRFGVNDKVLMTQVVPALNQNLPIINQARKALGKELNYVSLEGYITGKMFINALRSIKGEITRRKFLKAVDGKQFDIGGIKLDFDGDNQGSDLVTMTQFKNRQYAQVKGTDWHTLFNNL